MKKETSGKVTHARNDREEEERKRREEKKLDLGEG